MKLVIALAACAPFVAGLASAQPLTFEISFTNQAGTVPGTVDVLVSGLVDNSISPATNVVVTSAPAALGLTTPVDFPTTGFNEFLVSNGNLTVDDFRFDSVSQQGNDVFHLCMDPNTCSPLVYLANNTTDQATGTNFLLTDVTITAVPSPIPTPTALPLFAAGLGVMGLFGWRRKRKTTAIAARSINFGP